MKTSKYPWLVATAVGLTACAASRAFAEDAEWYLGAGVGRTQSRIDDGKLARDSNAPGFSSDAVYRDDHDTAYKVFAGYQFARYVALEGSYFDLGRFAFFAPTTPQGQLDANLRVRGFGIDALGLLPLTRSLAAYAKVGETLAETRDEFSASGGNSVTNPNPHQWRANPKFGAGVQYMFTPYLGVRGEWERYRVSDGVNDHGNVDGVFLNLVYAIPVGKPAPMPAAYVAPPPALEPARTPEPAVIPPPAPPPTPRRVSFSADALFDFNSAAIRPAGTIELDRFAAELRDTRFEQVHVIGYTDRIGETNYNQRLSERRAESIKTYLVAHGGIDPAKVLSEGKGSGNPVTAPGQCGARRSRATIQCLQPDRRVDVEVSGTAR